MSCLFRGKIITFFVAILAFFPLYGQSAIDKALITEFSSSLDELKKVLKKEDINDDDSNPKLLISSKLKNKDSLSISCPQCSLEDIAGLKKKKKFIKNIIGKVIKDLSVENIKAESWYAYNYSFRNYKSSNDSKKYILFRMCLIRQIVFYLKM